MTAREAAVLRDRVARARLQREKGRLPISAADGVYRVPPPVVARNAAIRYDTDEERLAARRRAWRESKERLHGTCPGCGGRKAPRESVKTCRACYLAALTPPAHGTVNRYVSKRFPCRCGLCREAVRRYHLARRQGMRAWQAAA